jgi:hypothetical protein
LVKQNVKKYKEEYYRNYYTFDGFYAPEKYKNIKKLLKMIELFQLVLIQWQQLPMI